MSTEQSVLAERLGEIKASARVTFEVNPDRGSMSGTVARLADALIAVLAELAEVEQTWQTRVDTHDDRDDRADARAQMAIVLTDLIAATLAPVPLPVLTMQISPDADLDALNLSPEGLALARSLQEYPAFIVTAADEATR